MSKHTFKSIDSDNELAKDQQNLAFADKGFFTCDMGIASCEAFKANIPILPPHRNYLTEISEFLEGTTLACSKFANVIKIENSKDVQVGHVINIHITEQIIFNQEHVGMKRRKRDYTYHFTMVEREHWLAQPSVADNNYLTKPAKYVIICHTATEEAFTQAENTLKMRLIQTYHIESKGWADIGYNFCVGSDGNVYEGRGWFAQGAHTLTYNQYSVGIAFLGCFLEHLPPKTALKRCKDLIAHGVKIGAIDSDYELIAHCQCRPFRSPGPRLFEEIKTWKNFNPHITNIMLCPLDVYEDTE